MVTYLGGMFALGATTQQDKNSKRYMEIGKEITNTCHESYVRTATGLGPDAFRFVSFMKGLVHHFGEEIGSK